MIKNDELAKLRNRELVLGRSLEGVQVREQLKSQLEGHRQARHR